MFIYEVTLTVDQKVLSQYSSWLAKHVKEVKVAGKFDDFKIFEADHGFVVHYITKSESIINEYVRDHAPRLRAEGEEKFGGKYQATRRILRQI